MAQKQGKKPNPYLEEWEESGHTVEEAGGYVREYDFKITHKSQLNKKGERVQDTAQYEITNEIASKQPGMRGLIQRNRTGFILLFITLLIALLFAL